MQVHSSALENAKIYDCFLFYNELDILEIRLNELYEHVDFFVLVESVETFRGNPKRLYFAEYKDQFAPFLDKIIHVIVKEALDTCNPWDRETFQRNQITRGLTHCRPNDVVLISDVDEIFRSAVLEEVKKRISTELEGNTKQAPRHLPYQIPPKKA